MPRASLSSVGPASAPRWSPPPIFSPPAVFSARIGSLFPSWFDPGKEIDITFAHIQDLFAYGLQMMLVKKESEVIMWVDNRFFRQR